MGAGPGILQSSPGSKSRVGNVSDPDESAYRPLSPDVRGMGTLSSSFYAAAGLQKWHPGEELPREKGFEVKRREHAKRSDFVEILQIVLRFSSIRRWNFAIFIFLILLATLFEGFGVAMLLPVLEFVENQGDIQVLLDSSPYWKHILAVADWFSVSVTLASLSATVLALLIVRQAFTYGSAVYSSWLGETILSDLRSTGLSLLLRADVAFHEKIGSSKTISSLTIDAYQGRNSVGSFFSMIGASLILLFYLILLFALSPIMTLVAAAVMGIVGFVLRTRVRWVRQLGEQISRLNDSMSKVVSERMLGSRVIKMAASESRESERFSEVVKQMKTASVKVAKIVAGVEAIVDPLVVAAGLFILFMAVEFYGAALSKVGIFLLVLIRLLPYSKNLLKSRQNYVAALGSLRAVTNLLSDAKGADVIRGGSRPFNSPKREITFDKVRFSYSQEARPALDDVSFSIPAGKMTALVGHSGAGKSTLVDLIPRLRQPQKGRVLVDGVPIEEFRLADLRRAIAFVPQDSFLFDDTLANNIRYARPEASLEEVQASARLAYADGFIEAFPDGYQTRVGERGVRLSGGERQRIVLARALLQKTPIVVLDEPTSALDSESEAYIQKALTQIQAERKTTLIVIAHRLSTIKTADQIVMLDKGSVAGCGSHEELIDQVAWYSGVATVQASV